MLRSGVIAKKVGMTRLFMEDGKQVPVTVLQLDKLQVVAQRTAEKDGYSAVQLGTGSAKAKRTSQAMRGHFAAAKVEPKRKVAEFRVAPENLIEVGAEISANHYLEGQFVDDSGTSIGKGFAGAMGKSPVPHPGYRVLYTILLDENGRQSWESENAHAVPDRCN